MTYAPAQLPVEHARAARRAGALGGALVGVGLPIAMSPAFAWASSGLYGWVASQPQVDPDGELDDRTLEVFTHMLAIMTSPTGFVLTFACLLVGAALVALGIVLSIRRMRRAGVHRPVGVALLGMLLARVGTWLVGLLLGGLPELLFVAWFPPLVGISFAHVYGSMGGAAFDVGFVIASVLVVVVGLVAGAGSWLGVGILTTWWMASALRHRVPAVAVQPWPAPTWSMEAESTDAWPRPRAEDGLAEAPAPRPEP